VTRFFPLTALALLTGCATHPSIQSNVDLDQLIKGKSKALPDREEAIPNTYSELTAWTGDSSKAHRLLLPQPGFPVQEVRLHARVLTRRMELRIQDGAKSLLQGLNIR
jgi:hypothetical protein